MTLPKRTIFLILILCLNLFPKISSGAENAILKTDSLLIKYESYISDFLDIYNTPGVAITIVIDTNIVFMKGFGVKKNGENDSIDCHTSFRIASVSKGFASILTGLLVKDGKLKWNDKVIKHLPKFCLKDTANTNNLTIQQILSHRTGLIPHSYDNLIEAKVPFKKIVTSLKDVKIVGPVGKRYGYQNVTYSLISEIIKSATGEEYKDLIKKRIFVPLGMKNVSLSKKGLIASKNFAHPHTRKNFEFKPVLIRNTYYSVQPAAGINASAYDMAQWLLALLGNKKDIIPIDIIKEVTKPLVKTPGEKRRYNHNNRLRSIHYGMGWRIFNYSGHTLIYHSGGVRGYLTQLAFLPQQKVGIAVLQNSWSGNDFLYKFLDMYLGLDEQQDFLNN